MEIKILDPDFKNFFQTNSFKEIKKTTAPSNQTTQRNTIKKTYFFFAFHQQLQSRISSVSFEL